jgi:DNA-binding transcriptional LysR family regulator
MNINSVYKRMVAMDLGSLQVFQTVARERSFSRAAEKLFRTQPAISISVRKLEDWVGQPLFVRGTGAGKLTEAGALLLEYAERMLNLRQEARRSLEDLAGLHRGRLALGVNESSIHALLPALERFRRRYPKIEIAIHRVFSREIPREILNYRLDLGIASYRPTDAALAAVEFLRDHLTFVVPPGHRLARRRQVSIRELGQEIFIAHIVASPYRERVIQLFARHRVPLRMEVEMPTIEGIKRFVERGMGVAIVPRMCVRREVECGQLAEVRIRQMRLRRDLFLIFRRDRPLSQAARAFVRLLRPRRGVGGLPSLLDDRSLP